MIVTARTKVTARPGNCRRCSEHSCEFKTTSSTVSATCSCYARDLAARFCYRMRGRIPCPSNRSSQSTVKQIIKLPHDLTRPTLSAQPVCLMACPMTFRTCAPREPSWMSCVEKVAPEPPRKNQPIQLARRLTRQHTGNYDLDRRRRCVCEHAHTHAEAGLVYVSRCLRYVCKSPCGNFSRRDMTKDMVASRVKANNVVHRHFQLMSCRLPS